MTLASPKGRGNQEKPNVGLLPFCTVSPSVPTTDAKPETLPRAILTPGAPSTTGTRLCGTGLRGANPPWPLSSSRLARTSASTPRVASVKSLSNTLPSVSVSTNVPDMNATPNTTAMEVRTRRSFFAISPVIVTRHMGDVVSGYSPRLFIQSSTLAAVGSTSSPTVLPSARKTTRSA